MKNELFKSSLAITIAVHKAQDEFYKEVEESNIFFDGSVVKEFLKLYNQYRAIVCDKK